MKKINFSLIFMFCCLYITSNAQQLSGTYILFTLDSYRVFSKNAEYSYIKFKDKNFILFNFKSNDLSNVDSLQTELHQIGFGDFSFKNNKLILNFKTDSNRFNCYLNDSIKSNFFYKRNDTNNICIKLRLKINSINLNNSFVVINTALKEFIYQIKNGFAEIKLPSNVVINSIRLNVMGYDSRVLPYDSHYNTFEYYYELNDIRSIVNVIPNKRIILPVQSFKQGIYYFLRKDHLKKIDQKDNEFFNAIANKNECLKALFSILKNEKN